MTDSLYVTRKADQRCPRCGAPSSATSVTCEDCRREHADRQRLRIRIVRAERRKRRRCIDCKRRCLRLRCRRCRLEQKKQKA